MSEILLKAENITKRFKEKGTLFTAVDNVSFELKRGEALGIAGGSGSGKSTLVRTLMHIIEPDGGRITFKGKDVTHLKGRELYELYRSVQLVFQMPTESFDPRRTLGNGICEGLINQGVSKKDAELKAEQKLSLCGLSAEFMTRYVHQVSGGQCQRAAIARALMTDPDIIILDEATSALDVTSQKKILELLLKLKSESEISFIMISHDLALINAFCDECIVMHNGKAAEAGKTSDIIYTPKNEYTKELIASILEV